MPVNRLFSYHSDDAMNGTGWAVHADQNCETAKTYRFGQV
jgi:hypothetical protein